MTLTRYFVIEQDNAFSAPGPAGGLKGFGPIPLGAPGRKKPTPPAVKVTGAEMTAKEAASERRRDGVAMVGRAMPIGLIRPRKAGAAATTAAGGVSWGIPATGADASKLDGDGVAVAVLDTGIEAGHPAFAGLAPEVFDFTEDKGKAVDHHGHGTHCAGTIFGRDVGGVRIGVARGIKRVLIGKVIPDTGDGDSTMLFDALNWANREGANIVSMSLGFDFPGLVEQLINVDGQARPQAVSNALVVFGQNLRAFDSLMKMFRDLGPFGRNMLVIAAAGNESERDKPKPFLISTSLPAAASDVVSVAALQKKGAGFDVAPFSNSDPLIAAPGVDIISAGLGGGLALMSGTSQACPHVAGLAALWWQKLKKEGETPTPDKVREKLFANAVTTKLPTNCDAVDRGRGRVLAP